MDVGYKVMTTMTFPNIVLLASGSLSDLLFFAILFRCLVFAFRHIFVFKLMPRAMGATLFFPLPHL